MIDTAREPHCTTRIDTMSKRFHILSLFVVLSSSSLLSGACGGTKQQAGSDAGPDTGTDTGIDAGADTGPITDDGGAADTVVGPVAITLSESSYTFETPDLHHGLTATVTGSATTTSTWTSSNTYIATVSAAGAGDLGQRR